MIVDRARDADAAGPGDAFEPGGDVDAIAIDIVALEHHVADIDADAQLEALVGGNSARLLGEGPLQRDSAGHRVEGAGELGEEPVAGGLDDAPAMRGDAGVEHRGLQRLEAGQRALLVSAHEAAVADQIGSQDGCEPSLHGPSPFSRRNCPGAKSTAIWARPVAHCRVIMASVCVGPQIFGWRRSTARAA